MARVVVLGGGFGGVAAANELRSKLGEGDEVVLVDRTDWFAVGFRKTWALFDPGQWESGTRSLASLQSRGIHFVQGEIEAIEAENRAAVVDGERLEADALVVALGAVEDPDAVPGFEEHGHNPYSVGDLADTSQALQAFKGGRLLVGVIGEPHPCPPAPYEMAYLLREFYDEREVAVDLGVFTPKPSSLPVAGEAGCMIVEDRLEARRIEFLPNRRALEVKADTVQFTTASEGYDLLLGIPPHRVPEVVIEAGLTGDSGWVEPDPETMATHYEGVYAIGDLAYIEMANGKRLPMAGVFAEAEGQTAAEQIAAHLQGRDPTVEFEGRGGCFLEMGQGEAVLVEGHFKAEPGPQVEVSDPSPQKLEAKRSFESDRLQRWFGG